MESCSLKYHRLHPEYIHGRIQKLGNMFNLRILLLMCDIVRRAFPSREFVLILAFHADTTSRPDTRAYESLLDQQHDRDCGMVVRNAQKFRKIDAH